MYFNCTAVPGAGFKPESDTYFSPCVACPLFYLPLPSALSPTVFLSQSQFWQAHMLTLAQMSKKQTSLGSFFEKGERPKDGTAEDSKTPHKKRAAFNRKYQLNYGSLQQVIHIPQARFVCGNQLSNEAMKPSKLLRHMQTKHAVSKDRPLEFFKTKNMNTKSSSNYRRLPLHPMCLP